MVRRALNRYNVLEVTDVVIVEILKMQTTTFVASDPKSFIFVGSIPEVMFARFLLIMLSSKDIVKSLILVFVYKQL